MPLYKTIIPNPQTIVKIWKITEGYNELIKNLSLKKSSLSRVSGMKHVQHQCGFLSVRQLLKTFGYTDQDLFYDENGKPHLKDGKYISITHSFNFSGVIISDNHVGIDIEKQRNKITLIANKFIGYEHEYLKETDSNYVKKLTVIWCIKEALYKFFSTPGLSFKNHCLIIPFSDNDNTTKAWIDYNDKKTDYNVFFIDFEEFNCAYVIA